MQHNCDMEPSVSLTPAGFADLYPVAAALQDVFRKRLPSIDSNSDVVVFAAMRLAFLKGIFGVTHPGRRIGRAAAKRECDDVADLADSLAESLEGLSNTVTDVTGTLDSRRLRDLAKGMRSIKDFPNASKRGAPRNDLATQAALTIIEAFQKVTGGDVGKPASLMNAKARGIEPLVADVFKVLGIDASARAAIHAAEVISE